MKRLLCVVACLLSATAASAELERSKPVALAAQDSIRPAAGEPVDVVPFGEVRTWQGGRDIGVLWEDSRDIAKVVIRFDGAAPDQSSVKLQYWLTGGWPRQRVPRTREELARVSGWQYTGDWYNGTWQDADADLAQAGAEWTFAFGPANRKEFTDVDFSGAYRSTMKLRLVFSGTVPKVASLHAFTDSVWEKTSAVLVDKNGVLISREGAEKPYEFEGFSAYVTESQGLTPTKLDGGKGLTFGGPTIDIWYAKPAGVVSGDAPVVTVHESPTYSFDPTEIAEGKRIFIRDLGVLIQPVKDAITYSQAEAEYQKAEKNRFDAVSDMPEQTLERAWSDMPRKGRIYMPVAVEGGRQHFRIRPNGDVQISQSWQGRVKGRDSDRCKWKGECLNVCFDIPRDGATGASIEDGALPIPTTWYEAGGIRYTEQAFATVLAGKLPRGGRVQAEEPQVLMLRWRLTNLTDAPRQVSVPVALRDDAGDQQISVRDGIVFGRYADQEVARLRVCPSSARVAADGNILRCAVDLPARSSKDLCLAIPFETLEKPEEFAALKKLDYDPQHKMIAGYWGRRLAQGAQCVTPEPLVNQFVAANPTHQLINTDNDIGSMDCAIAKVGTFYYGAYTNESVMMTTQLDRLGYHDVARKAYETWIHYQGTVALPGDYSSQDGVFYGAGGHECGGYNQHHGWALWGMGEHYWFTRDDAWLDHAAPAIIKACEWIIRERSRTKTDECTGIRAIERGLLPPGSLEDIGDYRCWMSNNVMTCWGMRNAARALVAGGNPDGPRLLKEAEAYRRDIRDAFFAAMARSPVVRLRDGTYVPNFPSDVHRRGRSVGWITEVLEGSIHMIRCGIIDPSEPAARWIMKDYEDNRYLTPPYGYGIPMEDKLWFSLGGFCQQPSLLCSPTPYLMMDEPKHYVRSYFNAFSAGYFPERGMLTEHPLPNLGDYFGDHFKSSDEAMNASWARWMFIWDEGDDLYLGKVMPRYWLRDGEEVKLERAATHFGPMGVSIRSKAASGSIEMTIDPPTRNAPHAIYARFRHPGGKSMNRVTVNGKPWTGFDPAKEWVVLPALKKRTVVAAYYD